MIKSCGDCRVRYCSVNCKSVISYLNDVNISLMKEISALKSTIKKMQFIKNPEVRMIEVSDSSLVEAFGYDMKKADLYLKFVNGTEYVYQMVPFLLFANMVNAQSRGKYYNDYIKGKYDVIRIDN